MRYRGQLTEFLRRVRASYWFIPAVMMLLAILASQAAVNFDEWMGAKWLGSWGFLHANKPDGARTLLSTIAGSMIGVAGVTFSITIAAVAYASSQFGPRIIDNFMKDRGNQVTLGTFIATFIYCLLVLRVVRTGTGDGDSGFVPHGAVFVGVILAVCSLAVLIFFIHHIPQSIHVSKLVADIGNELLLGVRSVYPESLGEESEDRPADMEFGQSGVPMIIHCDRDGHIQSLDLEALESHAQKREVIIELVAEPGDFVTQNQILAKVYGPEKGEEQAALLQCFLIGNERSPTQDLFYLSDQLIDIAGRALSPGINDPQTAKACISWLTSALAHLGQRELPSRFRTTEDGVPILVLKERNYRTYVDNFFDQLRPYVEKDPNAAFHMLDHAANTLEVLLPAHRRHLHLAAQRLVEGCLMSFEHPHDLERLAETRKLLSQANSAESQLRTQPPSDGKG